MNNYKITKPIPVKKSHKIPQVDSGLLVLFIIACCGVGGLIWDWQTTPNQVQPITTTLMAKNQQPSRPTYQTLVQQTLTNPNQKKRTTQLNHLGHQLSRRLINMENQQTYDGLLNSTPASQVQLTGYFTLSIFKDDLLTNHLTQQWYHKQQHTLNQTDINNQIYILKHQATIIKRHIKTLTTWLPRHIKTTDIKQLPLLKMNPMILDPNYQNAYFDNDYTSVTNPQNQAVYQLANANGPYHPSQFGPYLNLNNGNYVPYHQFKHPA